MAPSAGASVWTVKAVSPAGHSGLHSHVAVSRVCPPGHGFWTHLKMVPPTGSGTGSQLWQDGGPDAHGGSQPGSWHTPSSHTPLEQTLPQVRQLSGSLSVSLHAPLQHSWPLGQ